MVPSLIQYKFSVEFHRGAFSAPFCFLRTSSYIIRCHGLDFHLYADDTQLYLAFDFVKSQIALDTIQAAICDIKEWLLLNMLKFNASNTE